MINQASTPHLTYRHYITHGETRYDFSELRSARESIGRMLSHGINPTGFVPATHRRLASARRHWITSIIDWIFRGARTSV